MNDTKGKIVKCGCGLPMRQKNWAEHWNTCKVASSVDVTPQDIRDLEYNEARKEVAEAYENGGN